MLRKSLVLALFCASSAAFAGGKLPPHIVRQIQLTVRGADAVAVVKVLGAKLDGARGTVQLAIEKTVMGELPGALEIPETGFDRGDLTLGNTLLVALKQDKDAGWVGTGRYELVADGHIREYAEDVYLARTSDAVAAERNHRAARAAGIASRRARAANPTLRVVPAAGVAAPTNTVAPARSVVLQQPTPSGT